MAASTLPAVPDRKVPAHTRLFNAIAGAPVIDWLFMLSLLGIGTALLLGIGHHPWLR